MASYKIALEQGKQRYEYTFQDDRSFSDITTALNEAAQTGYLFIALGDEAVRVPDIRSIGEVKTA